MNRLKVIPGLLILILNFLGCGSIPIDSTRQPAVMGHLRYDLTVTPTVADFGDTISVTVRTRNDRPTPIKVGYSSGSGLGIKIISQQGVNVASNGRPKTADAPVKEYEAWYDHEASLIWVWDDPKVIPGVYKVQVGVAESPQDLVLRK